MRMIRKDFGKRFRSISFKNKLLLSYLIIITVPVLSALFIYGFNLYHQTKAYYVDLLHQVANRTDVIIDDFITNIARNSFFYLTDSRLQNIVERSASQDEKQYLSDYLYVQRALDQFILMNGNISTIMMLAPNGRMYGSTAAYEADFYHVMATMDREHLKSGKLLISAPYRSPTAVSKDEIISIIRYASDLALQKNTESYVKVDIKFHALKNMLGGASHPENQIGTLVIADGRVIYHTNPLRISQEDLDALLSQLETEPEAASIRLFHSSRETYVLSAVENSKTGWKIVQYLPSRWIDQSFLVNTRNYMLLSLTVLTAAFLLAVWSAKRFIRPIQKLNMAMKLADSENLDQIPLLEYRDDEIGRLVSSYNSMILRLKESREKEIRASLLQKRAELEMLRAKINPHFLYNTLNTIHSIAELNRFPDISIIAKSLSALYRYNIKANDVVTIGDELEQIKNYVTIQQIRFLGKFQVHYDIDERLYTYQILKFLLQPIVENAFFHGLEPKGGAGQLTISVSKEGHVIYIRIKDDGVGMSEEQQKRLTNLLSGDDTYNVPESASHIGLRNVQARIKNFYGDPYGLRIRSKPGAGTCVELKISAQRSEIR